MKAIEERKLHCLIRQLKDAAWRQHYYCEDTWYACPKHPELYEEDSQEKECNCGADEHNQKVEELYRSIVERL